MKDNFKSILPWVSRIALFIVPFIPLYVSSSLFFPYITGKAFIFRSLVELAFAVWLVLAIFYKEFRPQKTYLFWSLTAFVGVVILATIFGVNPYKSFWSNYERMEGLAAYVHLYAYFLVLGHVFRKKDWLIFFNLFVISGIGQNIYALLQKVGYLASPQGGFRVDGTIGNATYVAAYSTFVLAICLLLWLTAKKKWARYCYAFVGLWTLVTIYFTATRGAILGLIVGLVISGVLYLVLWKPKVAKEKLYRKIMVAGLIILIAASAAVKIFRNSQFIKQSDILSRFASISLSEGKSRFIIWNMGLKGFKERPLLGWGPENYNVIFSKYYDPRLYTQEPWFDRSHNIIFDWLINAGILGLFAYLSIFVSASYLIWKNYLFAKENRSPDMNQYLRLAVLISVLFLVYFIQNLFVFDQLAVYLSFFAILGYIESTIAAPKREALAREKNVSDPVLRWIAVGVAALLLVFAAYTINYKPLKANLSLLRALQLRSIEDLPKAFESYDQALAYNTLGNAEIREQFAQFTIAVVASDKVDQDFKEKVFKSAVEELQKTVDENPLDPRPYLFLGAVLSQGGLFDEALRILKQAHELAPTKQQIHFELADVYIKKQDFANAAQVLEQAYKLEPNFDTARIHAAAGYILNDEQEKADELLIKSYGTRDVAEHILTQVYLIKKNYQRLLGIWLSYVASDPKNIQYRKNVAAVYVELGRRAAAIKTLEEAIEIDPGFKQEGESYINEIKAGKPF